ncbi:MAG: hypothetical protein QXM96_00475 [Candidatus Woesearchaeota archaeon]
MNIFQLIISLIYYARLDFRYYYFYKYKHNLKKSHEEIQKYQLERLKKLLRHAYETTDYYKKLFDEIKFDVNNFNSLEDFKKIPVLTKELVKNNFDSLKSKKKYKLIEISSGGSTGNRVTILKDKRYFEISRAVVMRDLYSVGLKPGSKVAWVWGSPIENKKLKANFLERLNWFINRRTIFNTYYYTDEDIKKWLFNDLKKFNPDFIYGYATAIRDIALFAKKNNFDLKYPKLKKILTTAQKLEDRELIENVFKCKVLDHYGCREIESIAIEDENYVMHSSDDFVLVEVDKNNEIILTPLESYGMPLIRYKNGDIGFIKKKQESKTAFNVFNIQIGRSVEILRTKDGKKVYSGIINREIGDKKIEIGEFQLVQNSYDEIILNIVNEESKINKKNLIELKKIIKEKLGITKIKINYLKEFPIESSGKKIGYKCLIKD